MAHPSHIPVPHISEPSSPPPRPLKLRYPPPLHSRNEFISDQPVIKSSFSLLTFAGNGFVRLYSFPDSIKNSLRRFFDSKTLLVAYRKNPTTDFIEFSLDQKPWANAKNIMSEKLVVGILTIIFQFGCSLLSTIEYGREPDDRVAIAFSRATIASRASFPQIPITPSDSTSTSMPTYHSMLFAISFPTPNTLHVIEPPLPLTPAILQIVRRAWPRGIEDEKRVGDSYEFKLKGYKWFRENAYALDSLHQILALFSALSEHSFTLLISLTFGDRSRTKDFWIFTSPQVEYLSSESSPNWSSLSLEMRRDEGYAHSQYAGSLSGSATPPPFHTSSRSSLAEMYIDHADGKSLELVEDSVEHVSDVRGLVDLTGANTVPRGKLAQWHTSENTSAEALPSSSKLRELDISRRTVTAIPPRPSPPAHRHPLHMSLTSQRARRKSLSRDDRYPGAYLVGSPYDIARPRTASPGAYNSPARSHQTSAPTMIVLPPLQSPLPIRPVNIPAQDLIQIADDQVQGGSHHGIMRVREGVSENLVPTIPEPLLTSPGLDGGVFRDSSSTGGRTTGAPISWVSKDAEAMEEKRRTDASGMSHRDDASLLEWSPQQSLFWPQERGQGGGLRTELPWSFSVVTERLSDPPVRLSDSSGNIRLFDRTSTEYVD
ncbi:hypothetical protein C2E23DRAFT_882303 [Lenzites betulinus]|nr:hypothetical protein C2E23DRAFT_882303 [Lenzites betulinus]